MHKKLDNFPDCNTSNYIWWLPEMFIEYFLFRKIETSFNKSIVKNSLAMHKYNL